MYSSGVDRRIRNVAVCLASSITLVLSVVALGAPGPGAKHVQEFLGLWEGVDPLDGSTVEVSLTDVEGDGVLELTQREGFFSACFDQGAEYTQGRGVVVGTGTTPSKGVLELDSVLICITDDNVSTELPGDDVTEYTLQQRGEILRLPDFGNAPPVLLHRIAK
jgi:hypothetical protein